MKPAEYRAMSDEQLELTLRDTIKDLFHLRFQSATERLETPSEIQKAKREVARIKTIQREREQAAALLAEHQKLIADAKTQAHGIIAEGRGVSERERALAIEKTRQEQEELLARARREIAAERDRAVADLRREAVDLSLAAASRLIEKRLDGDSDRKLVLDFLATLDDKA